MLLIIGGFDPTAQAGILADGAMASRFDVPYCCCITANTIQTEKSFVSQCPTDLDFFRKQLEALLKPGFIQTVKIGYLGDIGIAKIVNNLLRQYRIKKIVIDPVVVGKRADKVLVSDELLDFYIKQLFPIAKVITPNWDEACVLTGSSTKEVFSLELMGEKAEELSILGKCSVIITGKSFNNKHTDCLINYKTHEDQWLQTDSIIFNKPVIGIGCKFATLIACHLSDKMKLESAFSVAKLRITKCLESLKNA